MIARGHAAIRRGGLSYHAAVAVRELLLASQNRGKLAEMRALLDGLPFRVLSPADLGIHEAPDETGTTFVENATIKALHYCQASRRLSVADDSGLSVDALGGGPGLQSSRFAGEDATDGERNALLLEKLAGVPPERRGAHFTCAVVVALPKPGEEPPARVVFEAVETVEGRIAEAPHGPNGFGYDPVFFYPPYGCTFGQVPAAQKDRVSHRGKAFARLRAFLAGI
jgi:XTP/dITP diphosphohydrolase